MSIKRRKKHILCAALAGALVAIIPMSSVTGQTGAVLTFDPTNWLAAIDKLYATYDQINNMITQVEQNYKQIQMALESAQSIDWENISFDGDIDVRNDIRNATKRVNKLLTSTRQLQASFTTPNISVGNAQYSFADLCGAGGDGKNFMTACLDMRNYMTENMKTVINSMAEELTDEQKKAIWQKYGISPQNYLFAQQSVARVKELAGITIETNAQKASENYQDSLDLKKEAIMQALESAKDSQGNYTVAGLQEANLMINQIMVEAIQSLMDKVDTTAELTANQMLAEYADKEAQAQQDVDDNKSQKKAVSIKSSKFVATGKNQNSWIDIPVLQALEYFSSAVAKGLAFVRHYAIYFGLIGLIWACYKLINSRMTVKDFWWDTIYKWTGFLIFVTFYPYIGTSVAAIGAELGTKVGMGKKQLVTEMTQLYNDVNVTVKEYEKWENELYASVAPINSTTAIQFNAIRQNEDLSFQKKLDMLEEMVTYEWGGSDNESSTNQKVMLEKIYKMRQEDPQRSFLNRATLQALKETLVCYDADGKPCEPETASYIDLNMWLRDGNGTETGFLSSASMMRIALLSAEVIWGKRDIAYERMEQLIEQNKPEKQGEGFKEGVSYAMESVGYTIKSSLDKIVFKIEQGIMAFFCAIVIIISTIFALIQYVMTILELTIISGLAVVFLPLMLFDGTKDIPKKFIPVFVNMLVKIYVMTACMMFVFWLQIRFTADIITDDSAMNLTAMATVFFNAIIAYMLTQNAPKIAQTILTGQPQLSMGEFVAAAGTAGAQAAMMGKPMASAAKGAVKSGINNFAGGMRAAAKKKATIAGIKDVAKEQGWSKEKTDAAIKEARQDLFVGAVQSSLRAVPKNMAKRVAAGISGSLHKTSSMGSMLSKATGGLVNFGGGGGHGGAGGSGASDALSTAQKQKNIGTAKVKDKDAAGHEFARDATIGEFMNERAGGAEVDNKNRESGKSTERELWYDEARNFAENYTGDAKNAASSDGSSNAPETHANMTDGERGTGK